MGQQMSLTDRASVRPLADDSTLPTLCGGINYVVVHDRCNVSTAKTAAFTLQHLGFVVVTNVYDDAELEEMQPTIDAMVLACEAEAVGQPAWGNRGPNRQSANGFFLNIESQTAGGVVWRNETLQCILAEVMGEPVCYGGMGVDVAFTGTVYQHLHSDDNCSRPFDEERQSEVRHRLWPPALLLAGLVLSDWTSANGPMRMIPWTAVSATEYNKYTQDGISYNDEKDMGFLDAFIVGKRGACLIRDPRCLHGGTPNLAEEPRSMVATFAYSQSAVFAHPELYVEKTVPSSTQRSLPRFRNQDASWNETQFHHIADRYGDMRTL